MGDHLDVMKIFDSSMSFLSQKDKINHRSPDSHAANPANWLTGNTDNRKPETWNDLDVTLDLDVKTMVSTCFDHRSFQKTIHMTTLLGNDSPI